MQIVRRMQILQRPCLQGFTLSCWFHGWGRSSVG